MTPKLPNKIRARFYWTKSLDGAVNCSHRRFVRYGWRWNKIGIPSANDIAIVFQQCRQSSLQSNETLRNGPCFSESGRLATRIGRGGVIWYGIPKGKRTSRGYQ